MLVAHKKNSSMSFNQSVHIVANKSSEEKNICQKIGIIVQTFTVKSENT